MTTTPNGMTNGRTTIGTMIHGVPGTTVGGIHGTPMMVIGVRTTNNNNSTPMII